MQRQPEPELMTDEAQALAYARADFAEPHERFVGLFRECFLANAPRGTVLDLGCGPADVTWRFAAAFPHCRVDGVDGSPAMLKFGRETVRAHGLTGRIRLIEGYLPGAKLPEPSYDVVISNSLLHHLADPAALWNTIVSAAKPGASIFIMDLLRPASEAAAHLLVQTYSGNEPEVLQRDFYNSLLAAYTEEEITEQLGASGLSGLSIRAVSDRHLIIFGKK